MGTKLRGGEVIELVSDLGGGKTTFVRGLAQGAGSTDAVASPTFTISKLYETPRFELHHFDFYRLREPGLITHELEDLIHDPQIVLVIEWGDTVRHILPEERLTIAIKREAESTRTFTCECGDELAYLLEGLC